MLLFETNIKNSYSYEAKLYRNNQQDATVY